MEAWLRDFFRHEGEVILTHNRWDLSYNKSWDLAAGRWEEFRN